MRTESRQLASKHDSAAQHARPLETRQLSHLRPPILVSTAVKGKMPWRRRRAGPVVIPSISFDGKLSQPSLKFCAKTDTVAFWQGVAESSLTVKFFLPVAPRTDKKGGVEDLAKHGQGRVELDVR